MARDTNWIDFANLGSNLFRNLQLNDVQSKLGAVASIAANEQATAESENKFREIIFQADTALRKLRALPGKDKAGVLALARESLINFKRYGISSACFRGFEDKERVRSVIEEYEALADECSAALPLSLRKEAELCAKYSAERRDLDLLILINESKQRLQPLRSELAETEATLAVSLKRRRDLLNLLVTFICGLITAGVGVG